MTQVTINLYQGMSHPCSYLAGQVACMHVVDPNFRISSGHYGRLLESGFRRSGDMVYRPGCRECHACIPARIRVNRFRPNRSQRRALKNNSDIVIRSRNAEFDEQHLALYGTYLASRHADGEMSASTIADMRRFLVSDWSETILIEGWLGERLVLSAVTDVVDNALSALYTYFDPDLPQRSLGTLGILQQIEACRNLGLRHLYLGYWIESCRKMRYKSDFSGLETRDQEGNWSLLGKQSKTTETGGIITCA
jgi:arginine-tRNA-protein transferase